MCTFIRGRRCHAGLEKWHCNTWSLSCRWNKWPPRMLNVDVAAQSVCLVWLAYGPILNFVVRRVHVKQVGTWLEINTLIDWIYWFIDRWSIIYHVVCCLYVALKLGLPLVPVHADNTTHGDKLLRGVNFASAASGIMGYTGLNFVSFLRTQWATVDWKNVILNR